MGKKSDMHVRATDLCEMAETLLSYGKLTTQIVHLVGQCRTYILMYKL